MFFFHFFQQESKKRPQSRTNFMYVPTITRRQSPINYRQHVIEYCTATLNHASSCQSPYCPVEHCSSMKKTWKHVLSCMKDPNSCLLCKNFQTLVAYHSKQCQNATCNVVFCNGIRKRRYSRSQLLNTKCHSKEWKFQEVLSCKA